MLAVFLESYVLFFFILLPAGVVALTVLAAARAGLERGQIAQAGVTVAAFLGLWGAIAFLLAKRELLLPPASVGDAPYVLILMLGGAFLLWALGRLTRLGRRITDAADPGLVIGFQIPRVMGAVFLIGWALGAIPWQFAIPAGLGDIWAGVVGYQAMRAVERGDADADRKIMWANVVGLGDFVVAVSTGLITSEGFLHLLAHDAPNIINHYPLALFPGFFVGIFIAMHVFSLGQLRRKRLVAHHA
ncbi:MAG: hypothetical protein AAFZ06_02910 [Pseudomonadota bacterium]